MYPLVFLLLFVFIGVPIILTMINIVLLFAEKKFKARTVNAIDIITFFLGISFTILLSGATGFQTEERILRFHLNHCRPL